MTLMETARKGTITKEIKEVAKKEGVSPEFIREGIAKGTIVVPFNRLHKSLKPIGIGKGLTVKINSNIGSSPYKASLKEELKKLEVSLKYGADTVMDLSTGGDIDKIRQAIIKKSPVPVGTVPIYQAVVKKGIEKVTSEDIFNSIEQHAKGGVDFVTVHCGVTRDNVKLTKGRVTGIVSRGGSFLCRWMQLNKKENPLYTEYDRLLEIAQKYDLTLSLGDGLRPGCLKDATDKAQIAELKTLGKLAKKAWKKDVQVMIEGPGHVPLNQIEKNIKLEKRYCHNAPFYVLGPLVTDIAPGYDHITSAIGGALAAYYGADYLCYVTQKEHLGLPNVNDVKQGVVTCKIAAHIADIAKGVRGARDWDDQMSTARVNLDWNKMIKLAIDSETAKKFREESGSKDSDVCSMCGKFCSMKVSRDSLK